MPDTAHLATRPLTPDTWECFAALVEASNGVWGGCWQTEDRPSQRGAYLHTGPEELHEQYGFIRVRKIAKWRWVMRRQVDAA